MHASKIETMDESSTFVYHIFCTSFATPQKSRPTDKLYKIWPG